MSTLQRLLEEQRPEDALFQQWQFALSNRLLQIMEERGLNQRDIALRARLTPAQVSAFMHQGANPTLSVLARISALLDADILQWVDNDVLNEQAHGLADANDRS